jgi:hypothetical protein
VLILQTRNDRLVETAVSLLGAIINILSPLPFFRTQLITLVTKVLNQTEPYGDIVSFLYSEQANLTVRSIVLYSLIDET